MGFFFDMVGAELFDAGGFERPEPDKVDAMNGFEDGGFDAGGSGVTSRSSREVRRRHSLSEMGRFEGR